MPLSVAYPYVEKSDGAPARLSRQPRIRVAQVVMDWMAHGWTVEEMCRQHPGLMPAEVHAAMLYYWDHRDEIDAEIRDEWDGARRERADAAPTPFAARMRASGKL